MSLSNRNPQCHQCNNYIPRLEPKCGICEWPNPLYYSNTISTQMAEKKAQRFGRLVKSFGDYGELRRQTKAPNVEVFYILVPVTPGEAYRSVQNASLDQINDHIRKVGTHLAGGAISQENAEIVLDYCYAELNRRLNP